MTTPGSAALRAVAAFDLDGTLTRRDCVKPFLLLQGRRRLIGVLLRAPLATVGALARRDRDALKAIATRSLRGLDHTLVKTAGEAFADRVARDWLRDDTVARLRSHLERGDAVVLVSASYAPYVVPLARMLGADDALCTHLETGSDGRLTGRIDGENCRGEEKARQLLAWLRDRELEGADLWAYGDSAGDDAMLALAHHPVRVGRARLDP